MKDIEQKKQEPTGTSYSDRSSLCFPFYKDCIIIIRLRDIMSVNVYVWRKLCSVNV